VAIESNVRYVDRLVPSGSKVRVLFTDGDPASKNVFTLGPDNQPVFRAPQLRRLDGPAELSPVHKELNSLLTPGGGPVFLYFTGHGSPESQSNFDNNSFDLWDNQQLTVTDLASAVDAFPKNASITLVMVECFSGAFGNVLFKNGDPTGPLADQNVCGFFASVAQREAAGCTPEINEADYKDFTGYFFAALTGTDRLGKPVTGADYDHDGKVGMNEAFCYALINDDSIDTPVCTSDVFLRRFEKVPDEEVVQKPYSNILMWSSPAQHAALEALSSQLGLTGEDRLQNTYNSFMRQAQGDDSQSVHLTRFVRLAKSVVLGHMFSLDGSEPLKKRYSQLLAAEVGNPLKR
jgi:hypothetical protein